MTRRTAHLGAALAAVAALAAPVGAIPQYTVTDLGTLGGADSQARAINAKGQTVGTADTASGKEHAFLFTGGKMTDLGTLGGKTSSAYAINAAGWVAGAAATASGTFHPFLYTGGPLHDLGSPGSADAVADAVNDKGDAVGWYATGPGPQDFRAFLYAGGQIKDLAVPPVKNIMAFGINNSGQVVGSYTKLTDPQNGHAFLLNGTQFLDLGTLEGGGADAEAVDDKGEVVGSSSIGWYSHAVRYSNSQLQDLGTLSGLNNADYSAFGVAEGRIVGCINLGQNRYHGFLYRNGVLYDLNDLIAPGASFVVADAFAVNALGQIVGDLVTASNHLHACRLDPIAGKLGPYRPTLPRLNLGNIPVLKPGPITPGLPGLLSHGLRPERNGR